MTAFAAALAVVLQHEGGYVNNALDRGGPTNHGITQATLSDFLGREVSAEEVASLTVDTAGQIYQARYWDPLLLSQIASQRVSTVLMDQAVVRGIHAVATDLQRVLSVSPDGIVGPETIAAANAMWPDLLIMAFLQRSEISYAEICASRTCQVTFLKGWLERTHSLMNGYLTLPSN